MLKWKHYILFLFIFLSAIAKGQFIVINEVMSKNTSTLEDADGEYPDWIELYNKSAQTVNLDQYTIREGYDDDSDDSIGYVFSSIFINPGEFFIVYASGRDTIVNGEVHLNFKIDSDGEAIVLYNNVQAMIDSVNVPELDEDRSYGRAIDGLVDLNELSLPTPGSSNFGVDVDFSHPTGFYDNPFDLILNKDLPQGNIYYTYNGSDPHPDSTYTFEYDSFIFIIDRTYLPNTISMIPTTQDPNYLSGYYIWEVPKGNIFKCTALKAAVFDDNNNRLSQVYHHTYFVDNNMSEKYSIPIFSLMIDSSSLFDLDTGIYIHGNSTSGNYWKRGISWERDAYLQYIDTTGEVLFEQGVGVRLHGGQTRYAPQKSFRFYAREEYGKSDFNYQLFPDRDIDSYKRFITKSSYQNVGAPQMVKDDIIHDLVRGLNVNTVGSHPSLMFVNGEYWGIQRMRERIDKHYIENHYGANKDSIDFLVGNMGIIEGGRDDYQSLVSFIENNDLSEEANYAYVESQIHIDEYITYNVIENFFQNEDWPGNNVKFWKEQKDDAKWRWVLYDLDWGFTKPWVNMFEHSVLEGGDGWPNPDWATLLFRNLIKNEDFKNKYIQRYVELVNTTLKTDLILDKIDEFQALYEAEIEGQSYRWPDYPRSKQQWLDGLEQLRAFAIERPCIVKSQLEEFFNLAEVNIVCNYESSIFDPLVINPDPNDGHFVVDYYSEGASFGSITITTFEGDTLFVKDTSFLKYANAYQIDLDSLQEGIYLVHVSTTLNHSTKQFVVGDYYADTQDVLSVTPNANDGSFRVDYYSFLSEEGNLLILNSSGEVIHVIDTFFTKKFNIHLLDLQLEEGLYFVQINTPTNSKSEGFIVGEYHIDTPGDISVYPNPNNGIFRVEYYASQVDTTSFYLFNVSGEVVYSSNVVLKDGENVIGVLADYLETGVYYFEMETGNEYLYEKVFVGDYLSTEDQRLIVYPNPNLGTFRLDYLSVQSEIATLTIIDQQGSQVMESSIQLVIGQNGMMIESDNLVPGIYIVMLATGEGNHIVRITIE